MKTVKQDVRTRRGLVQMPDGISRLSPTLDTLLRLMQFGNWTAKKVADYLRKNERPEC